ncbi:hypothetical protein QOZ80_3AG0247920 [Eleusine coracana subsp. coracana]|nr:hypothetical protein QOZ80_3AG0247920 [Eleusine coracana subsp. coracana]
MAAVPEELRCKRSDGKQWRCSAPSMPDKTVCEKHYVQAKKRSASSALRASLRRSSASAAAAAGIPFPVASYADAADPPMAVARPFYGRVAGEAVYVAEPVPVPEPPQRAPYDGLPLGDAAAARTAAELVGRSSTAWLPGGGAAGTQSCHQCRNDGDVIWCTSCDRRGYCASCIAKWYSDIPVDDVQKVCPACRGICNCKVCLQGDNLIKARVQEISVVDKLRYLHSLLVCVLPLLKQIYSNQCFEIGVETRSSGPKTGILRAKMNSDEQMCCDFCKMPVFDYHRHCPRCLYDLCLDCCRDIRHSRPNVARGEYTEARIEDRKEMVNSCKVHDLEDGCLCCNDGSTLELTDQQNFGLSECSNNDVIDGNQLYSPVLEDLKYVGISHFHKHWIKGEPVIIKKAFELSLSSSWDPLSIWRGIQEIMDEKMDEDVKVKAVDCSNQSEVNVELKQFIKGYSDGNLWRDGHSMLKLKEWPQPSVLEEFLLCQRPEFIVNFPLVDFIHPRWGLLNLAAKLPPDTLQPEVGMKLLVAHGSCQELGKGDSVTNLMINMGDVVHMLMHTAEGHSLSSQSLQTERSERIANGTGMHVNVHAPDGILDLDMGEQAPKHTIPKLYDEDNASKLRIQVNSGLECTSAELSSSLHSMECSTEPTTKSSLGTQPGALWDVFCRNDIPKLNEYLFAHWEELSASSQAVPSVKHAIYDQAVYLNSCHKKMLKDQYGIEPWTFHQHIGEAVFIPAGCPFQVKNLQSTVQLALDFLSPESLPESVRMAEEIRCLPNGHVAKLKMLEIKKISLYAASSAVREIQRLTLDPKFSLDGRFEDQNLIRAVSENLARVNRQRKVPCT